MNPVQILKTAEFVPASALGPKRIKNKESLLKKLEGYRRLVTITLVLLYALALVVAVGTVMMAMRNSSAIPKGLLPYVGGAAFVALLEFARRLTKDWLLLTLPLLVAEHASGEQLSNFVEGLLKAFGKGEEKEKPPVG